MSPVRNAAFAPLIPGPGLCRAAHTGLVDSQRRTLGTVKRRSRPRARITCSAVSESSQKQADEPNLASLRDAQTKDTSRDRMAEWPSLAAALGAAIAKSDANAQELEDELDDSCTWETPLFKAKSRADIVDNLAQFLDFFIDPTLYVPPRASESDANEEQGDTLSFEWILSFEYPLPWRPRIAISGKTDAKRKAQTSRIVSISDTWDVSPLTILKQAFPRLPDFATLYATPHPETDFGTRRLVSKRNGYTIERFAARPMLLVQADIAPEDRTYLWSVPAVPPGAFNGALRRLEKWRTVSPIALRDITDTRCEWAIPVPSDIIGSGATQPTPHSDPDCTYVHAPARTCAVLRVVGSSDKDYIEKKAMEFLSQLQRDGVFPDGAPVPMSSVWSRSVASKVGFNTDGKLAMATYGSWSVFPRRLTEIVVEIPRESE